MSDEFSVVCPTITGLGGKTWPIGRYVSENKNWSACNPSIAYSPELGYAMTVRSSNYILHPKSGVINVLEGSGVQSHVWFCELGTNLVPKNMRKVEFLSEDPSVERGIEDPKLFWRDGSWYFTGVMFEKEHTPEPRMVVYRYDIESNTAKFIKKWEGPDASKPEKNWMLPYEPNPNFDFIYGPSSIVKGDMVISKFNTDKNLGGLRGNSNLWDMGDGTYLAVVHNLFSRYTKGENDLYTQDRAYLHRIVRYDINGTMIEVGPEFVFRSLGVEFAAGLVVKGDTIVISWGERDATSYLSTLPLGEVLASLNPVESL